MVTTGYERRRCPPTQGQEGELTTGPATTARPDLAGRSFIVSRPAPAGNESQESLGRQEVGRGGAKAMDVAGLMTRWLAETRTNGVEKNVPPRRAPLSRAARRDEHLAERAAERRCEPSQRRRSRSAQPGEARTGDGSGWAVIGARLWMSRLIRVNRCH
jgi:hypothetical protein